MLFALPAAIAVPIIAGILVGGPVVGFPVAALVALVIVAVAIRLEPRARRRTAARTDARDHALAAPPDTGDHSWRRAAARRLLVPLLIAAAGIVLIAAAAGTVNIIGWGVLAVAVTVAISLVFLEIGRSEDRARARGARWRAPAATRWPATSTSMTPRWRASILSGKVVAITGASAGIGRSTAREMARRGAHVGLIARGRERLAHTADEVREHGRQACVAPADVADPTRLRPQRLGSRPNSDRSTCGSTPPCPPCSPR
jgi:hypothetical protein